jgi:iron(III) transport system ATP-binding protein
MVRGLHKAFGSTAVLTGVDVEVPAGSITAVLGPSGSGKTTLLRTVAGFERPDAGSIAIGDTVVADDHTNVPVERRRIGYVSQEGSLFPHLDVRANVGFGLPRRRRRGSRVDDLLGVVGLEGFAHRFPYELSGGQQQRVAIARALATGPQVLLLDEPFASLDANLRASVRSEVCAILRRAGTTAVLVTHDQDEALSIADLVAVLRRGTVAQIGTPRDLYEHPLDGELASFIGEANLIAGVVESGTVATPLGSLALYRSLHPPDSRQVTVLVRPEQLSVVTHDSGGGVPARVLGVEFHGHDATVRLAAEDPDLPSPLVARVAGRLQAAPGADVHVLATGRVEAWPAPEPDGPYEEPNRGTRGTGPALSSGGV